MAEQAIGKHGSTSLHRKDILQKRHKTDNNINKDKSPNPNHTPNPKFNHNTYLSLFSDFFEVSFLHIGVLLKKIHKVNFT